jgi:hypothetical protein
MSPMLALYSWPLISLLLLRRYQITLAILLVLVTGYMFLPSRFAIDFPVVPPMSKNVIPVLTVTAFVVLMSKHLYPASRLPGLLPKSMLACGLLLLLVLGPLGTVWANPEAIVTPLEVKRGLRPYDGLAMSAAAAFLVLPVLIGRTFFARPEQHRLILIVLCIAACAYALLALYEVRMSPRLNQTFYGFSSHGWRQHVRGDGFRPMVFMEHGLRVALFFALSLIATVGLARMKWRPGLMVLAAIWLFGTLVLCKSLGALIIAVLIIPMVLFLNTRMMILAAAVIAMSVLTYPILRGGGMVPIQIVTNFAASVDVERAQSFIVRLENEEQLLDRAQQKVLFGWGGFGRERVRNERGVDITIADGYWIITIGQGGWVRYIGEFGLMTLPMLFLFLRRRDLNITRDTAILSILLAANMIDLIPNSGQTPITWLIAGALWGRLELGRYTEPDSGGDGHDDPQDPPDGTGPRRREPVYARDFGTAPPHRERQLRNRGGARQAQGPSRRISGRLS